MRNQLISEYDIRRTLLFLFIQMLFALHGNAESASVTSYWNNFDSTNETRIDHSVWQSFLNLHVHRTDDDRTLVDYQNVDPTNYVELKNYISEMSTLDPRNFNRVEQMAYWINLYNALTVKVVLDNPEKSSITKMGQKLFSFGPWDEVVVTIALQSLSLNDIEHRILRPIWRDDRIHFALNCASLGCPNLAPLVFQSKNLEQSLNEARSKFLGHRRALHFNDQGKLRISSLFQWYLGDFAEDKSALLVYLASHRSDLHERILRYEGKIGYEYDWDLNSFEGITISNVRE